MTTIKTIVAAALVVVMLAGGDAAKRPTVRAGRRESEVTTIA